jgi:nitrous oxidase accessory protein
VWVCLCTSRNANEQAWSRNLDKNAFTRETTQHYRGIAIGKSAALLLLVFLTASCLILPLPVRAEPRTIVVPDDYSTIAAAIENAVDGDIVFVRKGTYREHSLVINKTITLTGEGASNSEITNIDITPVWDRDLYPIYPPPSPVAIRISANSVKVSGFTISGIDQNYEPLRLLADGAQIEDNVIEEGTILRVWSNNSTIARNSIGNGFIELIGSYNKFLHNELTGNASIDGAIYVKGSYNIVFSNVISAAAVNGWYSGINIDIGDNNIVAKNNLTLNNAIEIGSSNNIILGNKLLNSALLINSGSDNVLFANQVEGGGGAGVADNSRISNNTFYHNNFINNDAQIPTGRGGYRAKFDNGREGNYWSDYNGTDADLDGIGDTPYVIDYGGHIWKDNYPLMAPFDISTVTMEVPDWAFSVLSSLQSPSPTAPPSNPAPFPTALVAAASIGIVAVVGVGLLVYFKKRNHGVRKGENS